MSKKLLALFVAVVMLVSLLPTAVLAAATPIIAVSDCNLEAGESATVNVSISGAGDTAFSAIYLEIVADEGVTVNSVALTEAATNKGFTLSKVGTTYQIDGDSFDGTVAGDIDLLSVTISVAEDAENKNYSIVAKPAGDNPGNIKDNVPTTVNCTFTAGTITVGSSEPDVDAAYTAKLSSTTTSVNNDGTSTVSVDVVVGGTVGSFASTEIKLAYDPAYLTYSTGSCVLTANVEEGQTDQAVGITADNGVITIRDYGGNMSVEANGTTAYTVNFTTVKGGTTDVSLTSAGFSTLANAASNNLIYVTDISSKVDVTINHKATVTVDGTEGTTTTYVAPNGSYTYQISDYNATKYTYTVTATEGNVPVDSSRISIDSAGKVTITGVSDELAVTIVATANSYTITWKDNKNAITTTDKPTTQPYGTGISFTVKAGQAPEGTADGHYYSVKAYLTSDSTQAITVSSTETNNYAAKTYTIVADAITGDITIEVTEVPVSASQTTITISGDYTELSQGDTALNTETLTVNKNGSVTLTLNKEDGYTYTVQTKVGDSEAQDVEVGADGSFTIAVGEAALTLIVTKTLDTTSLAVSEYVQLDGKTMWLVKVGTSQITDKTYTYTVAEGETPENFFWSSKYNAYCFLVVTDTNTAQDTVNADVASKLGLTNTEATPISYSGNVNLTKDSNNADVIDVNDAQLVWNMYSAVYSAIDTNVTVQKFLEADMSGNGSLDTDDAAAVVSEIN